MTLSKGGNTMSRRSTLLVAAVMYGGTLSPLSGQSAGFPGDRVAVRVACHVDAWGPCRQIQGTLTDRTTQALTLDSMVSIPLSDVRALRYRQGTRRPIVEGLGIGAGAGLLLGMVVGAAAAEPCRDCWLDFSELGGAMTGGAVGLLLGGLIGAAAGSGMEVDRWHTLGTTQLGSIGIRRPGPAVGLAAGYYFPDARQERQGPAAVVRGSLAPKGKQERFAELSVRRIRDRSGPTTNAAGLPVTEFRTAVGLSVGAKEWIGFLGTGRVLPYLAWSGGYHLGAEVPGRDNQFQFAGAVGIDVFTSSTAHVFGELRGQAEDGGNSTAALFIGGKARL